MATACNFGDLKDSLERDRVICGIQDRQLREELLKIPDLDLQRYLSICRAAELSKTRTKTLEEGEAVNLLKDQTKRGKVSANKSHDKSADKRRENDDRNARDSSPKEVLRCKLFGGKHTAAKKSCPAFGKRYSACGKMNHFASQCLSKTRVSVVESESESEPDECPTRALLPLVQPKIYQKLLAEKERQALAYNRGATDLGTLRSGDTVRLVPPGFPSKEVVKAKVERCVGTQSFEVATEDGARYRRNRRHLRKKKEACRSSDLLSWLKKALSNRINSGHPYLNKHRLVMSSPRRVSGQPYPVVEWMQPMGMRWHLGNRSHLFSLVGYLCKAQQRDQAELLRSQLI